MTEHEHPVETLFLLHRLEGQQGAKGLPRTRPRMDQHIPRSRSNRIQATSQQLNQLLLPLAGPDRVTWCRATESKGRRCDGWTER